MYNEFVNDLTDKEGNKWKIPLVTRLLASCRTTVVSEQREKFWRRTHMCSCGARQAGVQLLAASRQPLAALPWNKMMLNARLTEGKCV